MSKNETKVVEETLTPEQIIENAKAEAERIIAEAKAAANAPAKNPGVPESVIEHEKVMREEVPVRLFYDGKDYKDDLFVRVNNHTYQIQRGVEVMVPMFVKEIIEASHAQEMVVAKLVQDGADKAAGVDRA